MAVETKFSELYASTQPVHEKSAELLAGISAMRKQASHLKLANPRALALIKSLGGAARAPVISSARSLRTPLASSASSAAKAVTPAASASIPKGTPRVTAPAPAPAPAAVPAAAARVSPAPAGGPQAGRSWNQQVGSRDSAMPNGMALGAGALGLAGVGGAGYYANTSQLEAPDWGPHLSYDQLRAAQKVDPDTLSVATRALMNPLQSIYSLGGLAGDPDRTRIVRTSADGTHSYAPTAYGQALQDNVSKRLTGAATANANNRMDSTQATAERDRLKPLLSQGGRPLTESDQRVLKIKPHTDASLGPMPLAGGGSQAGGELATFKPAPLRRLTY